MAIRGGIAIQDTFILIQFYFINDFCYKIIIVLL